MKVLSLLVAVLLLGSVAVAQEGPSQKSVGTLAEMMRAIFFTNSNVLFDVQTVDPGAPKEPGVHGETATERFGSLYAGWTIVDASAVALAEGANLLLLPGRICSNGQGPCTAQGRYHYEWPASAPCATRNATTVSYPRP